MVEYFGKFVIVFLVIGYVFGEICGRVIEVDGFWWYSNSYGLFIVWKVSICRF